MEPTSVDANVLRWVPSTEADLDAAAREGLLQETHYMELKREIEPGKANNKELARDLAALSIDGGLLIVGIEETGNLNAPFELSPMPLAGMRERIEAVSRSLPDPPLSVLVSEIQHEDDTALGYLVVRVPASPTAPHMVDGKYLGRGEAAKHYLSDSEVRRLHERRTATEADLLAMLERDIDRDPFPAEARQQAHLFLLAEPSHARPEMFLEHLHEQSLRQLLVDGAWNEETVRALGEHQRFSPTLAEATTYSRRATGAAFSTNQLLPGRVYQPPHAFGAEHIVDVEVTEEGAVHLYLGRLSDAIGREGAPPREFLLDVAAVLYTRQLLGIITRIASLTGYLGTWGIAIGATGLLGLSSNNSHRHAGNIDVDTYRRAIHASYADLDNSPGRLTERLLGQLLRNLGTQHIYAQELSDPTT